jgi:hypothetical protein
MTEKNYSHRIFFHETGLMGTECLSFLVYSIKFSSTWMSTRMQTWQLWVLLLLRGPRVFQRHWMSFKLVNSLGGATLYVGTKGLCRHYEGECWIDRPDFTPTKAEEDGSGRWHPGNLSHQIRGRARFPILKALHDNHHVGRSPDYALPDGAWHVTDYYDNIQSKRCR